MKQRIKSYFKDKFFNLLTTILVGIIAFIAREYFILNQKIFEKVVELTTTYHDEVESITQSQATDHFLILQNAEQIKDLNKSDSQQNEVLSRHEIFINQFNSK